MPKVFACTARPFFLLEEPRSGNTFLAARLVHHGGVVIPPETNFVTLLIDAFGLAPPPSRFPVLARLRRWFIPPPAKPFDLEKALAGLRRDVKFPDWELDADRVERELREARPDSLAAFVRFVFDRYCERTGVAPAAFGIKKGFYASYAGPLQTMFPGCRFVGIIRDGRAVFNSQKRSRTSRTGEPFQTDPADAARTWVARTRQLREIRSRYPEQTFLLHYEDLIGRMEEVLRDICAFLGVPYRASPPPGGFVYTIPERYGGLHAKVNEPPDPSRIHAWRETLEEAEIRRYEEVAADALVREGYSLVH